MLLFDYKVLKSENATSFPIREGAIQLGLMITLPDPP